MNNSISRNSYIYEELLQLNETEITKNNENQWNIS